MASMMEDRLYSDKSRILSQREVQPGNQPRGAWTSSESDVLDGVIDILSGLFPGLEILSTIHEGAIRTVNLGDENGTIWQASMRSNLLSSVYGTNPKTGRPHGIKPDIQVVHIPTGKPFFIEVKNQGKEGNAHERAMKYFTRSFVKQAQHALGDIDYEPFIAVFTGELATHPRYQREISVWLEEQQYCFLTDLQRGNGAFAAMYEPIRFMVDSMSLTSDR